jgi:chromosome partitioning protein
VLSVNALAAADTVIIPCQADLFSIQGLKQLESTIEAVRKYCNPKLTIAGILLTRHNGRTVLGRDLQTVLEQEAAAIGTKVFKQPIRDSVIIREAAAMQQGLFTLTGGAVNDYRAFIEEFEKGE